MQPHTLKTYCSAAAAALKAHFDGEVGWIGVSSIPPLIFLFSAT